MNGDKKSLGELIKTMNAAKLNADTGAYVCHSWRTMHAV